MKNEVITEKIAGKNKLIYLFPAILCIFTLPTVHLQIV